MGVYDRIHMNVESHSCIYVDSVYSDINVSATLKFDDIKNESTNY